MRTRQPEPDHVMRHPLPYYSLPQCEQLAQFAPLLCHSVLGLLLGDKRNFLQAVTQIQDRTETLIRTLT